MATILHLSDLHRSRADPVGNDELLAAISSDQARWPPSFQEGLDVIVVSGDIVQGVPLGEPGYEGQLAAQYSEALHFVDALARKFLAGDRSRLVLVPGNHDVDWNLAKQSMDIVQGDYPGPGMQLRVDTLDPKSPYRWSWEELRLLKVIDEPAYATRCAAFHAFRKDFYHAVKPDPLALADDLFFLEYPHLDFTVTGLSSWFGNDCFCDVGAFDPVMIAKAQDAIASSSLDLHLAVWHHGVAGHPNTSDFLDVDQLNRLIDYGYRVGLHGHQHRTGATVMTLKLPTSEEMALVGAGTLAAGRRQLPPGVHRQYNLVEIWPDKRELCVYVREAVSDLIFTASSRAEFGGTSSAVLRWSPAPRVAPKRSTSVRLIERAFETYAQRDYSRTVDVLRTVATNDGIVRKLRIEALTHLGAREELRELLIEPQSHDELLLLVETLLESRDPKAARAAMLNHSARLGVPRDIQLAVEARIRAAERSS